MTGIYIHEKLALSTIIDCKTPAAIEFRTKLGFNQHDLIMAKEQSVLTKVMKLSASGEIMLQHSVLSCRIDLHFLKNRLSIKVDEKWHKDRNEHTELERQNAIK